MATHNPVPADESVVVPQSVRDAAARAEAIHAAAYAPEPGPEPEPQPSPQPDPSAPEPSPQPDPPVLAPQPQPAAPVAPEAPTPADLKDSEYARRYNAMKGRYEASQRTIGEMQATLTDMGDELVRTQSLVRTVQQPEPEQPRRHVTPEDEQTFGTDFIGLAQRAAQDALAPELDSLRRENGQLKQQVNRSQRMTVAQYLDREIEGWREVNRDTRFVNWLRKRDIYSGALRQKLLDDAFRAADAPRVAQFFNGFLTEERATGQIADPAPHSEPPVPPAPREPAVPLATLAAPGRARPASGEQPQSADKPIFTRAQIAAFYADVRRGVYQGRETEKQANEASIFAAQREGRVR